MTSLAILLKRSVVPSVLLVAAAAAFAVDSASARTKKPQTDANQETQVVRIDASRVTPAPVAANYLPGAAVSPTGHKLGLNSRYLTLDDKPWLPVMGEFHFSRYPRAGWEEELLKMKAAGVNIVSTYVIWIHHEEVEGQVDWTDRRDLRYFAQLCAKHGLLLEPRIGPWAHAEARNGGLPDWVMKKSAMRRNDPVYLAEVDRWYVEIGRQLRGLMWKDGGPVFAIQLENEYSERGAGAGDEHILTLKKMAIAAGFDVPFYFVTGWDNAVVPEPAVLPVFGGYPAAPWDASTGKLPPSEVYAFRFASRVSANMGASGAGNVHASVADRVPFLSAEYGGGIEDTYHRRPVIQPDDVSALIPVAVGSGVNLYGSYMFQGGENPDGRLSTLQESEATGYPNDLPIKSYDFQAPLGEFGQERKSLGKMRLYQTFLNSFGSDLAPMAVYAPERLPKGPADLSELRASVRSNGTAGYLFVNNYVRNYAMPARPSTQFEVRLPSGVLRIPEHPIDIPSGAYFIWPFHLALNGVELRYSTAQLFTRLDRTGEATYYFAAVRGIAPEFAFEASGLRSVDATNGTVHKENGVTYVSGIAPGVTAQIEITSSSGVLTHLVVLSADDAEYAWKVTLDGEEHLLITTADLGVASDGSLRMRSRGDSHFAFTLLPPPAHTPWSSAPLTQTTVRLASAGYQASEPEVSLAADVKMLEQPGEAPPVRIGPANGRAEGVAQAPSEASLPNAGRWSVNLPAINASGLSNVYLDIRYTGDVARLYFGGKLLTDDFSNGLDWMVGLKDLVSLDQTNMLQLSVLPRRSDAPVYFETPRKFEFGPNGQAARVQSVEMVPEYEISVGSRLPVK